MSESTSSRTGGRIVGREQIATLGGDLDKFCVELPRIYECPKRRGEILQAFWDARLFGVVGETLDLDRSAPGQTETRPVVLHG